VNYFKGIFLNQTITHSTKDLKQNAVRVTSWSSTSETCVCCKK